MVRTRPTIHAAAGTTLTQDGAWVEIRMGMSKRDLQRLELGQPTRMAAEPKSAGIVRPTSIRNIKLTTASTPCAFATLSQMRMVWATIWLCNEASLHRQCPEHG